MTPTVKAQKGFMPKVSISAKRVDRPMQRKQSTKAHDRRFLIGEITSGLIRCQTSSIWRLSWAECHGLIRVVVFWFRAFSSSPE